MNVYAGIGTGVSERVGSDDHISHYNIVGLMRAHYTISKYTTRGNQRRQTNADNDMLNGRENHNNF